MGNANTITSLDISYFTMLKQTPQVQKVCKLWITVENTYLSVIFIESSLQNKESKSEPHVMNQRSFSCQDFFSNFKKYC